MGFQGRGSDVRSAKKSLALTVFTVGLLFGIYGVGQEAPTPSKTTEFADPATGLPPASSPQAAENPSSTNNAQPSAPAVPSMADLPAAGTPPPYSPPAQPAAAEAIEEMLRKAKQHVEADGSGGGSTAGGIEPKSSPTEDKFVPSKVEKFVGNTTPKQNLSAILHTSFGDIKVHLFSNYAPRTVKMFTELVKGEKEFVDTATGRTVARPFYTNLTFHRVIPGVLIQTGCPFGNGRGGPGFTFEDEISPMLKFDKPGMVAMANEQAEGKPVKDSNGSQFFITLREMPEWDKNSTIFGEVASGMDVVNKISQVKAGPTGRPIKRIYLKSIEIKPE